MVSLKVCAVFLLAKISQIHGSVLGPAAAAPVAVPAVRYSLVAPQNVRPFAAQVSTFTRGLDVYAAPYAAGVLGGPAIVPAPAFAPAVAPAPAYPAAYPAGYPAPAFSSAPFYPAGAPAVAPAVAPVAPVGAPAPLLPSPFARSVHAVAPGLAPALGHPLPPAPYLGW